MGIPNLGRFHDRISRLIGLFAERSEDRCGIQLGDTSQTIRRARLVTFVGPTAVNEAIRNKIDLLITHEPLFPAPLYCLNPKSRTGKLILELNRAGCAVLAVGKALDASPLGANRALAACFGARDVREIREWATAPSAEVKLAVFVPLGHENAIIEAIARGGGGMIGRYSHCTFRSPGVGTYLPLEGAEPWAGEVGRFEQAEETRLEARVPRAGLGDVMRLVRAAHPYEEMAYDIYPLEVLVPRDRVAGLTANLPEAMTANQI